MYPLIPSTQELGKILFLSYQSDVKNWYWPVSDNAIPKNLAYVVPLLADQEAP